MEFRNLLQQADYSLILPKEGIKPFGLITRKEKNFFSWFKEVEGSLIGASLRDILEMKQRAAIPKIKEATLPKKLLGSDILKGGGRFTANLISGMKSKDRLALKKAKTVLFSFANAKELTVNQINFDEYLQFAELNTKSPKFAEQVEKGNMYVIIAALTSNKLSLRNADDFEAHGDLSVETTEEYCKLKAQAGIKDSESYDISTTGDTYLTFAIKTAKIKYKDGKFRLMDAPINIRKSSGDNDIDLLSDCDEIIFE